MKRRGYQSGFYNLSAGVRDRESRLRKAEKIAYVLQELGNYPLSSTICLDVGCSSGIITAALAPLFARTIGVDYDGIALANISSSAKERTSFVQGDVLYLPFADQAVDIVICAQVYEHVPNDKMLIAEIYRVLKLGGIVFFSGPNKLFPIEPHFFLPFLHWLPPRWADRYLRLFRRGDHYYERPRTLWGLQQLVKQFEVRDVTAELFASPRAAALGLGPKILGRVPMTVWKLLQPVLPNFNWLLYKPLESSAKTPG